jgi:hypothetical protein
MVRALNSPDLALGKPYSRWRLGGAGKAVRLLSCAAHAFFRLMEAHFAIEHLNHDYHREKTNDIKFSITTLNVSCLLCPEP